MMLHRKPSAPLRPPRPHLHLLPRLDQDDRAALAQLGSYAFLVLLVVVLILGLALTAGFAHHLFVWAM